MRHSAARAHRVQTASVARWALFCDAPLHRRDARAGVVSGRPRSRLRRSPASRRLGARAQRGAIRLRRAAGALLGRAFTGAKHACGMNLHAVTLISGRTRSRLRRSSPLRRAFAPRRFTGPTHARGINMHALEPASGGRPRSRLRRSSPLQRVARPRRGAIRLPHFCAAPLHRRAARARDELASGWACLIVGARDRAFCAPRPCGDSRCGLDVAQSGPVPRHAHFCTAPLHRRDARARRGMNQHALVPACQ